MNTKQVEYFLELTQALNYRQASEKLGITQPTLSKAMQHLENDLGFSLFYKQGRSIRLTRQGELFLPYAREALLQLDQGVRTALEQRQVLRLGCIGAIQADVLPAFLKIFERSFPGAYVRIHNSVSYTLQDMLEEDQLDLVLCSPSARYSDLVFYDFLEQPLYVCLYPGHPLSGRSAITPEDLQGQDMVGHTKDGFFFGLYQASIAGLRNPPKIVAEADEDNTVLSLVRSKMGICIVAMNPTLDLGGLITVPFCQDKVHRMVAVGCKQERAEALRVKKMVAALKKKL